eukprot:NODE_6320_length_1683_cov_3.873393.p1 GENE.NODE_6320_length_1683_cov_3.873393~~NODE_6320_length_1683_cov_3.873393.p1  ORF type:complete len:401 (-),score=127.66 NODE_6320_length_1683_cov_3.873393:480-1532(-)
MALVCQAADAELPLIEGDLRRLAQVIVEEGQHGGEGPGGRQTEGHRGDACDACRHMKEWLARVRSLNRSKGGAAADQRQIEMHLRFVRAVTGFVEPDKDAEAECCACLLSANVQELTMLPCGHCFHRACVAGSVKAKLRCPECQQPTTLDMVIGVSKHFPKSSAVQPLRRKFGSKLASVVETIQAIQAREGAATKCLVFLQWEGIMTFLEQGLKEVGIVALVLRGNILHRQKVIARFLDEADATASVLLLSLEHSPTGMNLVCAHHVLLVHPMHAERPEDAASFETQAIGRARRPGQEHTVHVYRFVARDTVEVAVARQHQAAYVEQTPDIGAVGAIDAAAAECARPAVT